MRRINYEVACDRGLPVKELEQRQEARPDTIDPARLALESRARALGR
jgi:hypothetical protein